jgi:hypothetical protein
VTPAEPAAASLRRVAALAWAALWWGIAIGALWQLTKVVL